MLYDIVLRLTSRYDPPAEGGRHVVCIAPADLPGRQRAITSYLAITPEPSERSRRTDFFGAAVVETVFREPHAELVFTLRARVDRFARLPEMDLSPSLARLAFEIEAMRTLDRDSPHHFLGPSARVKISPELAIYARDQLAGATSVFEAVQTLGASVHRDIRFDTEATTVETSPEEAFAARHGVCQDFSHIMISGLRAAGVPAGYVSGFLRTRPPPGRARLEGADAMHAWVRAWCGTALGWVEFDPTNNVLVGSDHIVVAYGRDYADVTPLKGVLRASGRQETAHAVDVVASE